MAVGIRCPSSCAACWKTGSFGIDIKLYCDQGDCGATCPSGYDSMHCAKRARCRYVDLFKLQRGDEVLTKCSNSCQEPNCGDLGPCVCGTETDKYDQTTCKRAALGGCP